MESLITLVLTGLLQLALIALLALPVSCASWTITMEKVFEEFRDVCGKIAKRKDGTERKGFWGFVCKKIAYLPTCYYCTSHYVTIVAMVLYPVKLVGEDWRGYIFAGFAMAWIANLVYLTPFNLLRARLRLARAKADSAELIRDRLKGVVPGHPHVHAAPKMAS